MHISTLYNATHCTHYNSELATMSDHHLIDQATTHTGEIIYGTIYAIIHVISTHGNLI